MDIQLKKGLLELCVLKCLEKKSSYGYKIIGDMSSYIQISESTLYPILRRLEDNKYVSTHREEHNGRLRKYYEISQDGKQKLKDFKKEYSKIKKIYDFILGGTDEKK